MLEATVGAIHVQGLALVAACALLLAGCDRDVSPTENQESQKWIEITADTSDLPFSIDSATLAVSYTIDNTGCLKPLAVSGAVATPFVTRVVSVTKRSPQTFTASIAADRFKDEDYDGRGACHWRIATVDFHLKHQARELTAGMASDAVLGSGSLRNYYSDAPTDEPQPGLSDPKAASRGKSGKLYFVTVSAKEATHN